MNIKNSKLKRELESEKMRADNFYGQLQELSFVLENVGSNLTKKDITVAVSKFTDIRHKELDKDSIGYTEKPKINLELAKVLYGFHYELEFHFTEKNELEKVVYPKYEPYYRRIE